MPKSTKSGGRSYGGSRPVALPGRTETPFDTCTYSSNSSMHVDRRGTTPPVYDPLNAGHYQGSSPKTVSMIVNYEVNEEDEQEKREPKETE